MDTQKAQEIVNWCLETEGLAEVTGVVDSEDSDHIAFNVSFWFGPPHTKGSTVKGVKIAREWLEDCNIEKNALSPQMKGLMVGLA